MWDPPPWDKIMLIMLKRMSAQFQMALHIRYNCIITTLLIEIYSVRFLLCFPQVTFLETRLKYNSQTKQNKTKTKLGHDFSKERSREFTWTVHWKKMFIFQIMILTRCPPNVLEAIISVKFLKTFVGTWPDV